jgi:chromate transporter
MTAPDLVPNAPSAAPPSPGFLAALRFWTWLGFVSFGGPAGQIAIMHRELVERKRWISEGRFLHALNFCMTLPGPEAQQLATYLGWLMHRTPGGVLAGALFVLPSLAMLVGLSWIYAAHGNVPAIAALFAGIKPVVVAIVAHAAWRIGKRALRHPLHWMLAVGAFVALYVFAVPFPAVVLAAALVGVIGSRIAPGAFVDTHRGTRAGVPHPRAVVDDDTPTPAHAVFSPGHALRVVAACAALALAGYALVAAVDRDGTLRAMALFFAKAAFVTFGGAYAVLPYVHQAAVEHYGWLTASQMIDGLALGETTPGPLIMVVAFVGFVGAWTKAALGPDALALSGIAGACVATFFTFLPSFLFILVGGPLVESARGRVGWTAPLAGVTAAVVGVVANLAAFFALQVFLPAGRPDPVAILIALAAGAGLWRGRLGVIPAIAAGAACGLIAAALRGAL